jgi:hypothetical protein
MLTRLGAKEHHEYWYDDVKSARFRPAQSVAYRALRHFSHRRSSGLNRNHEVDMYCF